MKRRAILGMDTSCDDTGVGLIVNGKPILSKVASQEALHRSYGGVIPELASRQHLKDVPWLLREALKEAKITYPQVEAIGVTRGPGLAGSLLVGFSAAKALSCALQVPMIPVNHLEAHIFSAFTGEKKPEYPLVALIASGGHTELVYSPEIGVYELLGRTRDDAAGEAIDKVGRLLGLSYPAGQAMDNLGQKGNPRAFSFPVAQTGAYEFSYSGLKTAAKRVLEKDGKVHPPDFAASFTEAVIQPLVEKSLRGAEEKNAHSLILVGGVIRNTRLRQRLQEALQRFGKMTLLPPPPDNPFAPLLYQTRKFTVFVPPPELCTDNGLMVASAAYHYLLAGRGAKGGKVFPPDDLDVDPSLDFI